MILNFRNDFTFLIGLNGSGKTSALRIMMALLTPNLVDLAALQFLSASITVSTLDDDGDETIKTISAIRTSDGLVLSVNIVAEELTLSPAELMLLENPASPQDEESPVHAKALDHPVSQFIMAMATPMFLGLDRRFVSSGARKDQVDMRRREFVARRVLGEELDIKRGNVAAGLADVNVLVYDTMGIIRQKQEELDSEFRGRLLISAFDYKPAGLNELKPPSADAINQYRTEQSEIENAVRNLQIPIDTVRTALGDFFVRMNEIAEVLEKQTEIAPEKPSRQSHFPSKRKRRWDAYDPPAPDIVMPNIKMLEWMINKPQVDRITAHLDLLATYNEKRNSLREPIDRFLKLLNQFLKETGKKVFVNDRGSLRVIIESKDDKSIGSLSSGERQLVVMLGHLALNERLAGSGVFIIDEPELSLHISWQERFLDSLREANPSAQIIMATHSPAIILDRDSNCESLDKKVSL